MSFAMQRFNQSREGGVSGSILDYIRPIHPHRRQAFEGGGEGGEGGRGAWKQRDASRPTRSAVGFSNGVAVVASPVLLHTPLPPYLTTPFPPTPPIPSSP